MNPIDGGDQELGERRQREDRRTIPLEFRVTLLEVKVEGIISTIDSRFKAFEKGQDLILAEIRNSGLALAHRVETLEAIKLRAEGAVWFARLLGITGLIGGVLAIVKMIKG